MLPLLLAHLPLDDSTWITFDIPSFVQNFWSATFDCLTFGAIYGLVALGYTLVYGVLNLINFAHSEVFIVGAYGVVFTLSGLGFGPSNPTISGWAIIGDVLLALVVGMICSALTAYLLERLAYRPLRKRNPPRLAFLITAIGASFTIQYTIFVVRGANPEPAVTMFQPIPVFDVFGTIVDSQQIIIVIASVIGGLLAGAAALFYVMKIPSGVFYTGGFILGIKAFAAAVLGGIGNVRGALLGGLLLGLIGNYGQILLGNSQWTDVVAFIVLVVVLIVKPTGLLGTSLERSKA